MQMTVMRLRQALEPVAEQGMCELRTVGGGYRLALGDEEFDAGVFARDVGIRSSGVTPRIGCEPRHDLAEGLALWRRPALADVAGSRLQGASARST